MNSLEFLLAVLALAAFTFFILRMEQSVMGGASAMESAFTEKVSGITCTGVLNYYYAAAGGTLEENLECGNPGGKWPLIPENVNIVQGVGGKKIFAGTGGHYGQGNNFQR